MKKRILSLLMALALCLSLLPTMAWAGTEPAGTPIVQGSFNDGVMTLVNNTSYYLSSNVTGDIIVPSGVTATLDLNGKVLRGTSSGSVITVENTGRLTITDSAPTTPHKFKDSETTTGLWELDETDGIHTVTGGVITGGTGTDSHGGGVYVTGGTLNINGGNIIGNTAGFGGGLGVTGTVNMTGGSVIGNTADYGGGVDNNGIFNMYGGAITNNHAEQLGGGVNKNGELKMTGGSITNNTANSNGGGVYDNKDTLTLGGTAKITGNTKSNGTANNLYLPDGVEVKIGTDAAAPAPGMVVGVTMADNNDPITDGAGSGSAARYFTSDNDAYTTINNNNAVKLKAIEDDKVVINVDTQTPYTSLQAAITAVENATKNCIRLLADVEENITVEDKITLDLNGHVLKGVVTTPKTSVITVSETGNLTLIDTNPTAAHYFTYSSNSEWSYISEPNDSQKEAAVPVEYLDSGATFVKLLGGCITGGKKETSNGGGVYVSGTFEMNGGNIVGNTATNGGGVSNEGTFIMSDGTISGNTAQDGGGVYVGSTGKFAMNGGNIVGNTATGDGGGVYVATSKCLAAGTPITLEDGTRKPIETLQIGDEVRAFDHETGTVTTAKLFDLWKYPEQHTDAFTLHFSNGIDVTAVGGHCFFDKAANKYVAVTKENVKRYIGHQFYNLDAARWETLTGVDFLETAVDTYIIVTEKHLNCAANGMLSNEDGIYDILINLFAYGDDLKIDAARKAADLQEYGIWGFENAQYMSEDFYDALNLQYMNVAFGKGMITPEMFEALGAYTVEIDPELICGPAVQQCVDEAGETYFEASATSVQNNWSGPLVSGVNLGGTAQITGNTKGTGGTANNLYLPSDKPVTLGIGNDAPTGGMKVGVTMESPGTGRFTVPASGAEAAKDCFTSDNAAYIVNLNKETNEDTTDDYLELVAVYTITNGAPSESANDNHGYLTIDKPTAPADDTVTVTVTPADGYQLKALKYNDDTADYDITKDATTGKYQFTMPAKAVTVTAEFEKIPTPSGGGSSTPTVNVPVSGDKDSVKVTATVSGGNATVKNVTAEQLDKVGTGENVTIDLSGLNKSVSGVTIPKTTLENVAASDADGLEVKLPNGTTAVFDSTTVAAVAEQATGSNIQLVVDKENKAEQALTAAQKETVKELNDALVLDAYFVSNGKRISDFKGGEAELTVSYPTTKPVRVWYVAEDGSKTLVPSTFDGKSAKFVVTHFSHYAIEVLDGSSYAACPQDETCVYAKFTDADTKAWYHDGVHFCVESGYMQGVSADKFAPNGTLSRAMIVTMLWRMEGEPVVNYAMTFKDVKADQWYTEAVRWAQSTGVVDGYSADSFGPNDNVTREQLAVILYNYAKHKGIDTAKFTENTNTLSHNDVFTISDWATSGMHFCIAAGVVNGDNGMLYPQNTATRAQAASMMQRFCETVLEK